MGEQEFIECFDWIFETKIQSGSAKINNNKKIFK